MRRISGSTISLAMTPAAVGAVISLFIPATFAQTPAPSAATPAMTSAPTTPWGDPDLQGIWFDETDTPLQRPAKYAAQEFFTDAQRAELDAQRALRNRRSQADNRKERGTELDVTGSYNDLFISRKHAGVRTSRIMDPRDGRIPQLTPEAAKIAAGEREFRLALMRSTETCRIEYRSCAGGKYDPTPSPRFAERTLRYNLISINRHDGPEDSPAGVRCLTAGLPGVGGQRTNRIIQTPGGIAMFYDVGQGQGWQRNIVMDGRPHLPSGIRQWYGDSRGRWEGNTLIIDVTNFSEKTDFQGSRENLHLVERWRLTGPNTLEYVVTIEDPTVWTKSWTVTQEFTRQSEQSNRIYYEPRCNEGNYAHPGILRGARLQEAAFPEGARSDKPRDQRQRHEYLWNTWSPFFEDPTVWTKSWTVTQEFTRQSEQSNRICYEPRCNEGNYAHPGILRGARLQEAAFAEGRGPNPATRDSATGISGAEDDPLQ